MATGDLCFQGWPCLQVFIIWISYILSVKNDNDCSLALQHFECPNITGVSFLRSLCLTEKFYSVSGCRKFTCVLCSLCLIKKRKQQRWIERLTVALRLYAWICLLWSRNFLFIYYYLGFMFVIYRWSVLQQTSGYLYLSLFLEYDFEHNSWNIIVSVIYYISFHAY